MYLSFGRLWTPGGGEVTRHLLCHVAEVKSPAIVVLKPLSLGGDGLFAPLPLGPGSAEHLDEVHRHALLQELVGGHGSYPDPVLLADGLPSNCAQAGHLQPGRVDLVGAAVLANQCRRTRRPCPS